MAVDVGRIEDALRREFTELQTLLERDGWSEPLEEIRQELARHWVHRPDPVEYDLCAFVHERLKTAMYEWAISIGKALDHSFTAYGMLEEFWGDEA
jgi:hypothetical protein